MKQEICIENFHSAKAAERLAWQEGQKERILQEKGKRYSLYDSDHSEGLCYNSEGLERVKD